MGTIVQCAKALAGGQERDDFCFAIDGGRIVQIAPLAELQRGFPAAQVRRHGPGTAVLPGFVNGHSHAYQILLRGRADDLPFARWRSEWLYRILPALTPEEVRTTFLRAFHEMAAAGITLATEFFYLNGRGNEHARAAIDAARECGIRLVLARAWMDSRAAPAAFRESIGDAERRTAQLMQECPDANVCVAPHSLHGASPEMIRAAAAFAREHDCKLHLHLAEQPGQSSQLNRLEEFGALNERLVAIHAIHLNDEEKRRLAHAGASVVANPTTNQYLGDGICDIVKYCELGVPVGVGTDANVKPSIIDEMRQASLLQKLARHDGAALGAGAAFANGTAEGARALGMLCGDLHEGAFADYVVLNTARADAWSPLVNAVVYRAESAWIEETYVGGRCIYRKNGVVFTDTA